MPNPFLITACTFLMLMTLLTWVGYRLYYKPGKFLRQLGNPVISDDQVHSAVDDSEPEGSTLVTFLQQLGAKVPTSDLETANLRTDLIRAGYRSDNAAPVFYGVRILATLIMLMISMSMQGKGALANPVMSVALIVFGCAAGWVLPRMFLEKRVAKRQEILRLALPDALDLLVVSVEAGLGLDQAVQHVARELQMSHPHLSEEMSLVTLEMRAGKRRSEALRNFAERTGEGEIRKLIAILIQNDRFGTSMAESLRTHSDFMRSRRKQDAEERAGKVGVKLVFPIFFFILPSMMIVAAGPGILQVFKYLFPMMKQIG
jgi:tight adherence protein C